MPTPTPPKPNRRLERVAEHLRRELSEIIRREFSVQEVGLLTVNEVRVAPDTKTATAFMGFVGTASQKRSVPEKLHSHAAHIQIILGSTLRLKWTPVLTFVLDESIERGNRVLSLLQELERQPSPPANPPPDP